MWLKHVMGAFLAAMALASPTLVLHEKRDSSPSEWVRKSAAHSDAIILLRIALGSRNEEAAHDRLMDISDPSSPNFGKHWTAQQVSEFFAPSTETLHAVQSWLSSSGIPPSRQNVSPSGASIKVSATVNEAESLLGTKYYVWENTRSNAISISCDGYYIPQHLQPYIAFISPTVNLHPSYPSSGRSRQHKRTMPLRSSRPISHPPITYRVADAANLTECWSSVTPGCIRALYGVPASSTATQGNELGIFESGDVYDQEDLDSFFTQFASNIPNGTHPILQSVDGGSAPVSTEDGGGESTLDFDLSFPLVYPQQIKLFQTFNGRTAYSGSSFFDSFLDALDGSYCAYGGGDDPKYDPHFPNATLWNGTRQCGVYEPTNVISLSYELAEAAYSPAYEKRICQEYLKLALMGTSIIYSSGDNGTLSRAGVWGCLADGAQNPSFPSSCPYVTSVGATQIAPGAPVTAPEVAVNPTNNPDGFLFNLQFSSGGGFSNVFTQPSYQKAAVNAFLSNSTGLPPAHTFNRTGRGFPDVSANGYNIAVYTNGYYGLSLGTSASAPIFASLITRLNEERILAGKKAVGFLNNILYQHPEMFNDITEGYNLGCNAHAAFYASKGWDPVTGLGTPNYPKMRDVFLSLP